MISLENVRSGVRIRPPKIVLYGDGGIGKTTFAASAPSPIFLFTEEGQGMLDVHRFEPRDDDPVLSTWDEVLDCVRALYEEDHEYKTVVLDTLDAAEKLVHRHLCKEYNQPKIDLNDKGSQFAFGRGYLYAADEVRKLLDGLDMLRSEKGMSSILLAHHQDRKVDPPDTESYTEWTIATHKAIVAAAHDWSDCTLFAQWRGHVVKDKDSRDPRRERARAVSKGERVVYTERRLAWLAKNRYSLPPEMPLSYAAFSDAVQASADAGLIQHDAIEPETPEQEPTES